MNSEIFRALLPGCAGRRGTEGVGLMPISRSFCTVCWVGFGLELASRSNPGHIGQVHKRRVVGAHARLIWRTASRNGSDSMSPTVPPISTDGHVHGIGRNARATLDEFLILLVTWE